MGEIGNSEVFGVQDESSPQATGKELEKPSINDYKTVLNACFDEAGNFASKYKGKRLLIGVWNGEHILADLLHEPEATQYQAVFLGVRPLAFFNVGALPLEHSPSEMARFFEDDGVDLNIYVDTADWGKRAINPNVAIYRSEQIKKVIETNADVFDDYKPGEPIDSYLHRTFLWGGFDKDLAEHQNPLVAFKLAGLDIPPEEVLGKTVILSPVLTPLQYALYGGIVREENGWGIGVAKKQAERLGLLLGIPRDILERAIERKIAGMKLREKLIGKHNSLMKSSDDYKDTMKKIKDEDFDQKVYRRVEDRILELATQQPEIFNLNEDEINFMNGNIQDIWGVLRGHFMFPANQGYKTYEIEDFNKFVDTSVRESGIKSVQDEFSQRYRANKMRGLTGALKRMLKMRTRVD